MINNPGWPAKSQSCSRFLVVWSPISSSVGVPGMVGGVSRCTGPLASPLGAKRPPQNKSFLVTGIIYRNRDGTRNKYLDTGNLKHLETKNCSCVLKFHTLSSFLEASPARYSTGHLHILMISIVCSGAILPCHVVCKAISVAGLVIFLLGQLATWCNMMRLLIR